MANTVDPVTQMRFMASIKRQSAPPRCNPFAIVIQVLALGMVFIGLTMTIIANWPGATTIGENPLKIAGPVLLAVGFSAFLIGMIVVCILNKRERTRWEKTFMRIAASRPTLDPSQNLNNKPEVAVTAQPHEVRKSAPIYTGSGNVADAPSSTNDWSRDESFDNNGDGVPDAVRVKKTRRQRQTEHTDEGATTTTTTTVVTTTTEHEEVRSKRPKPPAPPPTAARDHGGESDSLLHRDERSAAVNASPGESRRLRVHVKALPGATVRIQQGSTGSGRPPVAPKPAFAAHNQSTGSAETDI